MPVFISDIRCRRAVRPSPANLLSLVELTVFFVRNGFEPLVGSVLAGNLECKMGEPAIGRRPVPVLDIRRNVDDRAGKNLHGRLSLFLIPAAPGHADQHLSAAVRRTVDMPVVPAAGFERDIGDRYLLARNRGEVAVAGEILGVCRIRFADRENHFALESGLGVLAGRILGPHALCQVECRPRFRPTGIETDVGDNFGDLRAGDSVLSGRLKMENERINKILAGFKTAIEKRK